MKHGDRGVMHWPHVLAGSFIFVDDVTAVRSSKMNSEVCRSILSTQVEVNAFKIIRPHIILQKGNDSKHITKATKEFFKAKKIFVTDQLF